MNALRMVDQAKGRSATFVLDDSYPDAAAIFAATVAPIASIKDSAAVILDTNVLLVPFAVSPQTLDEIRATYGTLAATKRLFVPGQVAREFARNRATKLADLHQQLLDRKSRLPSQGIGKHPLLENVPEYQAAVAKEAELLEKAKEYGTLLTKVADVVRSWTWNDPVSDLYREMFTAEVIADPMFDRETVEKELSYRFANQIPPGYKDASKPDAGVGDLLVWKTILHIAQEHSCDVIFVSGEEKSDWWHKSGGRQLYPRFELLDEFRRTSGGRSLHIVSLSELLAIYGADQALVTEVRETERAETSADLAALLSRLPQSLRAAVDQLPYLEKLVYLLAEVEHLPHKEIAARLGVPVGTVGWRLFDARNVIGLYFSHPAHPPESITFPREQRWDITRGCVEFPAVVDGERLICRASEEALEDYFGATGSDDVLPTFIGHRAKFERIAREKLMVEDFTEGAILISTDDFHRRSAG